MIVAPRVLFHASPWRNKESIEEKGLVPGELGAVYFSEAIEEAVQFVQNREAAKRQAGVLADEPPGEETALFVIEVDTGNLTSPFYLPYEPPDLDPQVLEELVRARASKGLVGRVWAYQGQVSQSNFIRKWRYAREEFQVL